MRTSSPDPLPRVVCSGGAGAGPDLAVRGENDELAPRRMFARLTVVLAIALGFGLAAQFLVGVPH